MFTVKIDTAASEMKPNPMPSAWLRIAIPSFKVGWRENYAPKPKHSGPTVNELKNLFRDDFRQSAKAGTPLTDDECREYNQMSELRSALYSSTHH